MKAPPIAREVNVHASDRTPSCTVRVCALCVCCVCGRAHEHIQSYLLLWRGHLPRAYPGTGLVERHRTQSVGTVITLHSVLSHWNRSWKDSFPSRKLLSPEPVVHPDREVDREVEVGNPLVMGE